MSETVIFTGGSEYFEGALVGRASVVASEYVAPRMVRITMTSEGFSRLGELLPCHLIRLYFPPPDSGTIVLPRTETEAMQDYDDGLRVSRPYTVRSYDKARRELAVDFVVHDPPGVGSQWAVDAAAGDTVGYMIPGSHPLTTVPIAAIDERTADCFLLVGDETALPHIGGALEYMPSDVRAIVIAEVEDAGEEQTFDTQAKVEFHWLHRDGAPAGASGMMERALREMPWPEGRVYAWVVAETKEVASIRRFLRAQHGMTHDDYTIAGFWRRGMNFTNRVAALGESDPEPTEGLTQQQIYDQMVEG